MSEKFLGRGKKVASRIIIFIRQEIAVALKQLGRETVATGKTVARRVGVVRTERKVRASQVVGEISAGQKIRFMSGLIEPVVRMIREGAATLISD